MNKNILATIFSTSIVSVALGVFYLTTPPIGTGGISYLRSQSIIDHIYASNPEVKNLVIDRSRDSDGILSAIYTSEGADIIFKTDANETASTEGNTVITSTIAPRENADKSYAVMSTMLFDAKKTPSLVITINGDKAFGISQSALKMNREQMNFGDCLSLTEHYSKDLELSVKLTLTCDLRLDQVVSALSMQDTTLTQEAALNQRFLEATGSMKKVLAKIAPTASPRDDFMTLGSTINVYYKADKGSLDSGINFVYKTVK